MALFRSIERNKPHLEPALPAATLSLELPWLVAQGKPRPTTARRPGAHTHRSHRSPGVCKGHPPISSLGEKTENRNNQGHKEEAASIRGHGTHQLPSPKETVRTHTRLSASGFSEMMLDHLEARTMCPWLESARGPVLHLENTLSHTAYLFWQQGRKGAGRDLPGEQQRDMGEPSPQTPPWQSP